MAISSPEFCEIFHANLQLGDSEEKSADKLNMAGLLMEGFRLNYEALQLEIPENRYRFFVLDIVLRCMEIPIQDGKQYDLARDSYNFTFNGKVFEMLFRPGHSVLFANLLDEKCAFIPFVDFRLMPVHPISLERGSEKSLTILVHKILRRFSDVLCLDES